MKSKVVIFDTTCRDGKQAPGNNHSPSDTLRIGRQAEKLGIDVFEAGFPASSEADFEAVSLVANECSVMQTCALARATSADIFETVRALSKAKLAPRLHTFIATSDIHLEYKLKMSRQEALERAVKSVTLAKKYVDDVQFSAEDATRSDPEYLRQVVGEVIKAGARTINLPDTVGYALPHEIADMVKKILIGVPEVIEYGVVLSVHCHNDLGLATVNTLSGIEAGALQVECTINGIGERAGNAHLAEVVMALQTRSDYFGVFHSINTKEIGNTARLLSSVIGKSISDTLPIVGQNVFAHGAGIHQHGVLSLESVYEIMSPDMVGWDSERFPLSSQSGRHGLFKRLQALEYVISQNELSVLYEAFLKVASTKALVSDNDLHQMVKKVLDH